MKKTFLLFGLISIMQCSFGQDSSLTKEEYLRKSKGQKTGAIVLLSAGGALAIVGLAIETNDLNDDLGGLFDPNYDGDNTSNDTVSGILFFGGVAAMLGSIPLFISSHKNKKRAMSMSFENITAPQLQKNMVFNQHIPSVTFKVNF